MAEPVVDPVIEAQTIVIADEPVRSAGAANESGGEGGPRRKRKTATARKAAPRKKKTQKPAL
jgi:hypothetical protein